MPGSAVRLALVEVAAQPDVAVGQREHRLALAERGPGRSRGSRTSHGSTANGRLGSAAHASELRQILHDDVGAVLAQRVGLPDAVDADDVAEAARAARLDAGERVLEHAACAGLDAERAARREERVGRGLAAQAARARRRRRRPGRRRGRRGRRRQHLLGVGAGGRRRARAQARSRAASQVAHRAGVDVDALAA